ncbi:MAG TPA: Na+/H+ antiporter NhaC family protein [Bacteroidetes bacterium]|nr:Na+/H+ antiporter NhaC family protein [Bacteroidota bacterium]
MNRISQRIFTVLFALIVLVNPIIAQQESQPIDSNQVVIPPLLAATPNVETYQEDNLEITFPEIVVASVPLEIKFHYKGEVDYLRNNSAHFFINGKSRLVEMVHGDGSLEYELTGESEVVVEAETFTVVEEISPIPIWLSIIPPILAILMALVFREVITALFTGIFVGGAIIHVSLVGIWGIPRGLLSVLDTYIVGAIADTDHVSVIIFSMLIGAIVAVISRNGGMRGVVDKVSKFAKTAMTGQLATWFLGVSIFFDDYANTLVVGNTMRPVTDRLRISREKLSYLVDSTAAPVAAIAFITTWIGAELGYIKGGMAKIEAAGHLVPGDPSPYGIFVDSLQYSFYPILTLIFMLMLILKKRDFGPMYKAEVRARTTGQVSRSRVTPGLDREKSQELDDLEPVRGVKPSALNAIIPIAVIILGTIIGLWATGISSLQESWVSDAAARSNYDSFGFFGKVSLIVGASNSYAALLWASLSGLLVAMAITLGRGIMSLEATIESVLGGFKTMLHAMSILILAWALAKVTDDLHTAEFITQLLGGNISPYLLPLITFLLAAVVSFSTGSSWGTMAILYPLIIPAVWEVSLSTGLPPETILPLLHNTVACVLAGSVLGDHCSPISDTTILSSLASSCHHIDHVRTQMPYALTVGAVSVIAGTLPGAYGVPFWVTLPVCIGILYGIVHFIGKPVPDQ